MSKGYINTKGTFTRVIKSNGSRKYEKGHKVTIKSNSYEPPEIRVKKGVSKNWYRKDTDLRAWRAS